LLPSCVGTSYACGIGDFNASSADPSGTIASRGAAVSRGELEGTMAGSLVLAADGTTRGKCGDDTRHAAGQ
jgi:hypothetical protein